MEAGDYSINSEWSGSVKTIGTVRIGDAGVVKDGSIIANNLVLAGKIENGKIQIFGSLEVSHGAAFDPAVVEAVNLVIGSGAHMTFPGNVSFKNVEIIGELEARLSAGGTVTIRPGGFFRGELTGDHLVVDDGGGLAATLAIKAGLLK